MYLKDALAYPFDGTHVPIWGSTRLSWVVHKTRWRIRTYMEHTWFDVVPAVVTNVRRWKKASTIAPWAQMGSIFDRSWKTTISKCTGIVASPLPVSSILFGHYSVWTNRPSARSHFHLRYPEPIMQCKIASRKAKKKLFVFPAWWGKFLSMLHLTSAEGFSLKTFSLRLPGIFCQQSHAQKQSRFTSRPFQFSCLL